MILTVEEYTDLMDVTRAAVISEQLSVHEVLRTQLKVARNEAQHLRAETHKMRTTLTTAAPTAVELARVSAEAADLLDQVGRVTHDRDQLLDRIAELRSGKVRKPDQVKIWNPEPPTHVAVVEAMDNLSYGTAGGVE